MNDGLVNTAVIVREGENNVVGDKVPVDVVQGALGADQRELAADRQDVLALAADYLIDAFRGDEGVVTETADQDVVPGIAIENVVQIVAEEGVIELRAGDILDIDQGIGPEIVIVAGRKEGDVVGIFLPDGHRQCGRAGYRVDDMDVAFAVALGAVERAVRTEAEAGELLAVFESPA